ncbi:MAG: quinohemoprotein amine dehydrogenase [Gemmatimonadetes bacterium]|nr:quinohemoprotein amine dehydrogenase [Gemmatimonadota bacterium]
MKHLKPINQKAVRIEAYVAREAASTSAPERDVVGLRRPPHEQTGPHFPLGCSLVFSPGWEVDSDGGTAGLCQPVERDIFDCHLSCFWPAHVPDQLNHALDWTGKCASAQKDWRNLDLIFP